jgi:excisionase family DNA binding protein
MLKTRNGDVIGRGPSAWRDRETVTVDEVAEILGISRNTAYEAVRGGEIPALRLRKRWIVPVAGLVRLLDTNAANGV